MTRFSFHRFWAIVLKEFIQMKRDRVTFAMMVGIPLMQLTLFGFAINSDPKHLPAAIRAADQGPFARTLVAALKNSGYFTLAREAKTEAEAAELLQLGEVQFVINIPEDFSRRLLRGERPTVLIEADATDPAATGPAVSAARLSSETCTTDGGGQPSPSTAPRSLARRRPVSDSGTSVQPVNRSSSFHSLAP